MSQQIINLGTSPNSKTGDPLRDGMQKAQANFTELYTLTAAAMAAVGGLQPALGYTPENVANKDTDAALAANSATRYPSQSAVKTYVDARLLRSGGTMTGNLLFTDNTIDIGANGATRPRTIYVGTSVVAPLFTGALTGAASANVLKAGDTMSGDLSMGTTHKVTNLGAPTAGGDASTKTYVDGLVVGLLDDRGSYDASGNTFPAAGGSGTAGAILKGDLWYISVGGTLGGTAVTAGDTVRALVDTPGQTAGNWNILELNIGFVPENVANKSTDGTLAANSDTLYPTQQAVRTYIAANSGVTIAEVSNYDGWAIEFFDDYALGAISAPSRGVGWGATGVISGGTIVSRSITNGKTEKRLSITGPGYYGRQFSWGSDWLTLELAILVRINGGSTFSDEFQWGACSGITNMYNSATCANFIGASTFAGNSNAFTFAAAVRCNRFAATYARSEHKHNTTITAESSPSGTAGPAISASETFRHPCYLKIQRGVVANTSTTTTYTTTRKGADTGATLSENFNCGKRQLLGLVADWTWFSWFAGTHTGNFLTQSEANGVYDGFNLNWPNASNPLEIAAIAVRKVQ